MIKALLIALAILAWSCSTPTEPGPEKPFGGKWKDAGVADTTGLPR